MPRRIVTFIMLALFLLIGNEAQASEKEKRMKEAKLNQSAKIEKPAVRIENAATEIMSSERS